MIRCGGDGQLITVQVLEMSMAPRIQLMRDFDMDLNH